MRIKKRWILLSIMVFYLSNTVVGQIPNLRIKSYSLEEGLSHSLVTRIKKDKFDFVWLATRNGLNRFDGYEFLDFAAGESSQFPISGDYIDEIEIIEEGKFMITYKDNLTNFDFLDPVSFEVTPIYFKELVGETSRILSIFAEQNGKVYFLWRKGSTYSISSIGVDGVVDKVYEIPNEKEKWGDEMTLVKRKNNDFYLFDGAIGLYRLNNKGLKEIPINQISFNSTNALTLNFLKEDQQNRFWLSIAKHNGVLLLNEKGERFDYFETPIGHKNIPRIWEDQQGNLIFGESIPSFHPSFINFFLLTPNKEWTDVSYFTKLDQYIIDLESDDFFNTTLFGTVSGFKIAVNKSSTIKNMLHRRGGENEIGKVIRGMIALETGKVIIPDEDGYWYEINTVTDSSVPISLIDKTTKKTINATCTKEFIYDSSKHILWGFTCGINGKGSWLLKVKPNTWEAERFYFEKRIESFCKTKDGLFWLICSDKVNDSELFQFDPTTEKITSFRTEEGINPLGKIIPNFIQTSKNGRLLIGTFTGLFIVDIIKKTLDLYGRSEGLTSNAIEAFLEIDEERALIGTNKGLDIYNFKTKEHQNINKKDGLSANHIYGIIEGDKTNTYWVSTILGLNFLDFETNSIYNFFERDGLTDNEFNRFSHFKDEQGLYYFGGVNGVNIFRQEDLLNAPAAPKPFLTKMAYFNRKNNKIESQVANLSALTNVTLQPNDKYLELFFGLPEYSNPENNQYQVKLEGYDQDWEFLGTKNYIRYNALPAGVYTFLVKGATSKGNWSEDLLAIDIKVLEAFYKTWQFWLLISLLIGVILQLFNDYQLKQKLKLERVRTKLSSDLHDEVSGLLSGIAMQSELLEMVTTDNQSKPKLSNITKVSRSAMSRMSDVIWSIDSRKDSVDDLLARMSEHTMDILDPLGISWEMDIKNINRKKKMPVLLRENLYFIYKEAINNIGKHANTTTVKINFGNENKQFKLSIYNDGEAKIMPKKSNKQGQGTANMAMRAAKINATLSKEIEAGFRIILKMESFA